MEFKKEDENYIYEIISKNIKKLWSTYLSYKSYRYINFIKGKTVKWFCTKKYVVLTLTYFLPDYTLFVQTDNS